jgi:hypothetical protein
MTRVKNEKRNVEPPMNQRRPIMTYRFLTAASVALLLIVAVMTPTAVHATPISYKLETTGNGLDSGVSGTLGNFTFGASTLTLFGTGDTAGITNLGPGMFINTLSSASFALGVPGGSGTFTDTMRVFVDQTTALPSVGFFNVTANGGVFEFRNSALVTYDLSKAFGPVSGSGGFPFATTTSNTTAGALSLKDVTGASTTFTASVPEPTSLVLLGAGLFALAAMRRRLKA